MINVSMYIAMLWRLFVVVHILLEWLLLTSLTLDIKADCIDVAKGLLDSFQNL